MVKEEAASRKVLMINRLMIPKSMFALCVVYEFDIYLCAFRYMKAKSVIVGFVLWEKKKCIFLLFLFRFFLERAALYR